MVEGYSILAMQFLKYNKFINNNNVQTFQKALLKYHIMQFLRLQIFSKYTHSFVITCMSLILFYRINKTNFSTKFQCGLHISQHIPSEVLLW